MKDAIAMLMICVTSLEGVEGQFFRYGSASPLAVYHGEALIIGGTVRDKHGENFTMPAHSDPKLVWRYCQPNLSTVVGEPCKAGGSKPAITKFTGMINGVPKTGWIGGHMQDGTLLSTMGGLCIPFNHTRLLSEFVAQDPPSMPGYTICGKQTQLTVYLRGCCKDCIHYKTIGHCDNSALAITQCLTIKSAFTDSVHAVTSHYRLTPCNFNATTPANEWFDPSRDYRGPMGKETSKNGGIKGADIIESEIKDYQSKILGNSGKNR